MSGTLPTGPAIGNINITSNQPILVDKSQNGKRQSRKIGGHLWSARISYEPMTKAEFMPVWSFTLNQQGDSFTVTFPHLARQGTATGTAATNNNAGYNAGDSAVNIDGITGTIKAGDYFKFANHTKVYMFTADATAGALDQLEFATSTDTLELASSTDTLDIASSNQITGAAIFPDLIESVPDNTSVTLTSVPFTMATKNQHEFKASAPTIMRFELDLEEAIS